MTFQPLVTFEQLMLALRVLALAGLAFWILLLLDRKRWWPSDWSLHLDAAATQNRPGLGGEVSVVIPARNEVATLPRTLPRLLKQADWFRTLVVVDDRSTDHTGAAVQRLGKGTTGGDKLQVVRLEEPREDWEGKVHAMDRGVSVATRGWEGDPAKQWILFTDADILHPTSSISRLMAKATAGGYDMVSVMVRLRARAFWEQLLIPAFTFFFQLMYPFKRASDPSSRVAAAAGGCILLRRSVLEEIGGLEVIRDRRIDDVALAKAVKRAGGKIWLGLDPDMSSIRTYVQLGDVVKMVARTAFEQLGSHYVLVPIVWLALAVFFVLPPLLVVVGGALLDPVIAAPAAVSALIMVGMYLPVVQYLEAPSGFALVMPITALLYGWMTTVSAARNLTGRRIPWRDNVEVDNSGE